MDLSDTFLLLDALEAIGEGQVQFLDDGYSQLGVVGEKRIDLSDYLTQGLVRVEPSTGSFAERYVHLTPDGVDAMEMARLRVREYLRRMKD